MKHAKQLLAITIILAALVSVWLGFNIRSLVPAAPANAPTLLAFSVAAVIMYAGASLLFVLGLKNFTARLKLAYSIFCTGMVLFALSKLQVPAGTVLGLVGTPWMDSGMLVVPIALSIVCMYVGVRMLARLFGVQSLWARGWFVLLVAALAAVGAFFLPILGQSLTTETATRVLLSIMAICLTIFIACIMLANRANQITTVTYAKPMFWFMMGLVAFAAIAAQTMLAVILVGTAHWWLSDGYATLVQVLLVPPILKAGYEFNAIGAVDESRPMSTQATPLDIVMAAAAKVSNMRAISETLDRVRRLTAHKKPEEPLTPEDEHDLKEIYRDIEHYLVEKEPVRRYSGQELRLLLCRELHLQGSSLTFFD